MSNATLQAEPIKGELVATPTQFTLKTADQPALLQLIETANQHIVQAANLPLDEQIVAIQDQTAVLRAIEEIVKTRNFELKTGNAAACLRLHAEATIGDLLNEHCKHGGDRRSESSSMHSNLKLDDLGVTKDQSSDFRRLAKARHLIERYCEIANQQNVEVTTRGFLERLKPAKPKAPTDEQNGDTQPDKTDAAKKTSPEGANGNPSNGSANGHAKKPTPTKPANRHTVESGETDTELQDSPDDRVTPHREAEFAETLLHGKIDVDPCASRLAEQNGHSTIHAETKFTEDDDGLKQPWRGTVYLNPPYSDPGPWVDHLLDEIEVGHVTSAAILVAVCSETKWWARLNHFPRVFIRSRLRFLAPGNGRPLPHSAAAPSCLIYTGRDLDWFAGLASRIGDVFTLYKKYQPPEQPTD